MIENLYRKGEFNAKYILYISFTNYFNVLKN